MGGLYRISQKFCELSTSSRNYGLLLRAPGGSIQYGENRPGLSQPVSHGVGQNSILSTVKINISVLIREKNQRLEVVDGTMY